MNASLPLSYSQLQDLPQFPLIREVSNKLRESSDVVALWIGGSIARGESDSYSDIDYRVAVTPETFSRWLSLDLSTIFPISPAGVTTYRFGHTNVFYHMLLCDGTQFDLFIQCEGDEVSREPNVIIECRSSGMRAKIEEAGKSHPDISFASPTAEEVEGLLVRTWIDMSKTYKVLIRGLAPILLIGQQIERLALIRLSFILSTGLDCGDLSGPGTIHAWSKMVKVNGFDVSGILSEYALPMRTKDEVAEMLDKHRDELSTVGRELAARFRFSYPEDLEKTVKSKHATFLADWRGK